jgi:hypothetical protein
MLLWCVPIRNRVCLDVWTGRGPRLHFVGCYNLRL